MTRAEVGQGQRQDRPGHWQACPDAQQADPAFAHVSRQVAQHFDLAEDADSVVAQELRFGWRDQPPADAFKQGIAQLILKVP